MKKFLGILMIVAAVAFLAGNANAYFTDGDLIRVVYTGTGDEVATDLGSLSSIQSGAIALNSTNAISQFSTAPASTVNVFYFEETNFGSVDAAAVSTPTVITWVKIGSATTPVNSNISAIYNYYSPSGTATVDLGASTNAGTYATLMNSSWSGMFGASAPIGTTLGTNPATMELYSFTKTGKIVADTTLSLITNIDGNGNIYTTDNAGQSATPIPPSVLLFGSGLLGLIGMKRRSA